MQLKLMFNQTPLSFINAYNKSITSLQKFNITANRLERDPEAFSLLLNSIAKTKQKEFMCLSTRATESAVAISFYAGNGIVTKICDSKATSKLDNLPYCLPPITEDKIETDKNEFYVRTYPWIPSGNTTYENIQDFKGLLSDVGMQFSENDDQPKNVHLAPNKEGTLIGIDDDMFNITGTSLDITEKRSLIHKGWLNFLNDFYPIYKER